MTEIADIDRRSVLIVFLLFIIIVQLLPHFFNGIDVREDRILSYGSVRKDSGELQYKIKATNVGKYVLPLTVMEHMYDPTVKAIGKEKKIEVIAN